MANTLYPNQKNGYQLPGTATFNAPTTSNANFNAQNELSKGNTNPTGTDLNTGIFGETYSATQADVDAGLADKVGDQLGNTINLPQAEGDLLKEVLGDGQDAANIRLGASDDKFSNLTGMLKGLEQDKLNVLGEQLNDANTAATTLTDASTAKFNEIQNASQLLQNADKNYLIEKLGDAKIARNILDNQALSGKVGVANQNNTGLTQVDTQNLTSLNSLDNQVNTGFNNLSDASNALGTAERALLNERLSDAGTATDTLKGAAGSQFDKTQSASAALAQAEYDANRAMYQNVTDALRADRLGAMRQGESATTGTTDRMRLEAEMRAAKEYANLDNAARVREAERTLANTQKLGQQETDFTNVLASEQAENQIAQADVGVAGRQLQNVGDRENKLLGNQSRFEGIAQENDQNFANMGMQNEISYQQALMGNVRLEANETLVNNVAQTEQEKARRTLENTAATAAEKAQAQKIISDTQFANNQAQVKLASKQDFFTQLQQRDTERQQIADELANVVQTTQEKTLPAVKLAELLIEQAIDEGNMEVKTAEEKYQAKVEKAKELLANPSLIQVLSEQVGEEALTLGAEYTAEQQVFLNRINNLKNIPAFVDKIMASVSDEMFAAYEATFGAIGAVWAAGVAAGLVDADGLPMIPSNQFGLSNTPENTIDNADTAAGSGSGDSSDDESLIDVGFDTENGLGITLNL